jgi:transposase
MFLLPPSIDEWLSSGHLARFIPDVVSRLDLSGFYGLYGEARDGGAPAYDPAMMISLLFYAYCTGMWSSRRIERATYDDMAFRYICGNSHPDHDSICAFRSMHISSIAKLFVQILMICRSAGLVKVGDVVVDGTKILASASGQKTMTYQRLCDVEKRLRAKVEQLLRSAKDTDTAEDKEHGGGNRGDDLPSELASTQSRLAAIEAAKSRLEEQARAEAKAEEEASSKRVEEREEQERRSGKKKRGRPPATKEFEQLMKERLAELRANVTDPDSQLMQDGATKSIVQAYNCQTVVDAHAQVIVAANATTDANDKKQLVPMLNQAKENLGESPNRASADAGYFSRAAVTNESLSDIDLYVSPSRAIEDTDQDTAVPEPAQGGAAPDLMPRRSAIIWYDELPQPKSLAAQVADAMREKLRTPEGKQFYRQRGAIVEGPFGQIKEGRGFRRLSMRGKEKADGEWKLVCMTHNILKLWRSGFDLVQLGTQTA